MSKTLSKARRSTLLFFALLCHTLAAVQPGSAEELAVSSTALLVTSLNQPHVVRGDDGRDHVEYDLLVTNAFASPVTLATVEIIGPGGAVLGRIEGPTLAAATQGVLEQASVAAIPASGRFKGRTNPHPIHRKSSRFGLFALSPISAAQPR